MQISVEQLHVYTVKVKEPIVFQRGNTKTNIYHIYVAATSLEDALRKFRGQYPDSNPTDVSWVDYNMQGIPLLQ